MRQNEGMCERRACSRRNHFVQRVFVAPKASNARMAKSRAMDAAASRQVRVHTALSQVKGKRKLKRNTSRDTLKLDIQSVKCIRGGKRKEWFVLETMHFMGRECVSIKSTQKWFHVLLAGQLHNSQYHHAICNFVNECVDALHCARVASSTAGSSQAAPSQAQAALSQGSPPAPLQDDLRQRDSGWKGRYHPAG